jgi:hypothetical protein
MFNTPKDVLLIAEAYSAVLEAKAAKPDYIDIDGDGNKKESMKKAATDKKKKPTAKKESLTFRELYASVIND